MIGWIAMAPLIILLVWGMYLVGRDAGWDVFIGFWLVVGGLVAAIAAFCWGIAQVAAP